MLQVMSNLLRNGIGSPIGSGVTSSLTRVPLQPNPLALLRVLRVFMVGHVLKNEQTQLAHAVCTLNAEYRLLLTGTPLQKYPPPLPLVLI